MSIDCDSPLPEEVSPYARGQAVMFLNGCADVYVGRITSINVTGGNLVIRFEWLRLAWNSEMGTRPPDYWEWLELLPSDHISTAHWSVDPHPQGLCLSHTETGDDIVLVSRETIESDLVAQEVKEILDARYEDSSS